LSLSILSGILAKNNATSKKARTKVQEFALTSLPGWTDKEATTKTMFGRKQQSRKDTRKDVFLSKSIRNTTRGSSRLYGKGNHGISGE
jgi:hypothetical protein